MAREFPESYWKIFRDMHAAALERFCANVLAEVNRLAADNGKSHRDRYADVYELIRRRDRDLAATFDGLARSAALRQLALMQSQGLLTADKLNRFSPATREALQRFVEL